MKRIGLVILSLSLALPGAALAQTKDPLEGTVTKTKSKKDPFYGLSLRLGLRMSTGLNFEPESGHLDMSYQFKIGWAFGKKISPKGWAKHLAASLRFNVAHQPAGYSPYYRTGNVDPNYRFALAEEVPIGDRGYFLSRNGYRDIPRTQDGAPRVARFSDLMLTVQHGQLYKIPKVGIAFDGLVRFMFPTSVRSKNSTMLFALTGAVGASRSFKFKAGQVKQSITLSYTFGFTKYFHEYKTGKIDTIDQPFVLEGTTINEEDMLENTVTSRNPSYAFSNDFSLTYAFYKGMSLTLSYGLLSYRTYSFGDCQFQYNPADPGAVTDLCATGEEFIDGYEPEGWRDYHGFSASLTYSPLPYLGLMLALSTQAPQRMFNSRDIQQPFLVTNRNGYSTVMLTAYLTLDKLYTTLTTKKK